MSFESHRISKDYVLLDFLFDHDVYRYGQPLDFQRLFTDGNLQTGQKFVDCLLQPLTDKCGPTSIAGAFWPAKVRTWSGHYRSSPHQWNEQFGAAADVVFHDHVNRDEAPIKLCHEIDRSNQDFDRIITYAGSEFICFCYRESKNRTALYENVRVPGEKAQYVQHGQSPSARRRRRDLLPAARPDWRRAEDEGIGKSGNRLRAHHIRVGRYLVLLDFCRSVEGLRRGIRTVPRVTLGNWNTPEVKVARRFADDLDPLVDKHGRVRVLRGMERAAARCRIYTRRLQQKRPSLVRSARSCSRTPRVAYGPSEAHHQEIGLVEPPARSRTCGPTPRTPDSPIPPEVDVWIGQRWVRRRHWRTRT